MVKKDILLHRSLFLIVLFLGFYKSVAGDTDNIFRKHPYLIYPGDIRTMTLLWQTYDSVDCTVEWGVSFSSMEKDSISIEYGDDHQHRMNLENLMPDTKYFYRVIAGADTAGGDFFTGKEDDDEKITFYAYGDTRTYPADHDSLAGQILRDIAISDSNQTFIISDGDLVGRSPDETSDWTPSEEKWDTQFFDPQYRNIQKLLRTMPYMACVGNYEVEAEGIFFRKYFPYSMFGPDRFYYSFNNGPVHFTVVDQYTDYSVGSEQYNWIKNDLETTTRKWKMILFHEPGWSAGGSHGNNADVQNILQPLAVENEVQFFFGGHNHYYSRAVVDGIVHITTGGGGAPLYNPVQSYPKIVKVDKSYHFCKIEIDGNSLAFTAIRADGSIIESFSYGDIEVEPKYSLSLTKNGLGTVTASPTREDYEKGEMVLLQATPDSGYMFSGWSGDATGTELYYYLFMDSDKDVTATFSEITTGTMETGSGLENLTVYPNPSSGLITIGYELKNAENVTLSVYNLLGVKILGLLYKYQSAGSYRYEWNLPGLSNKFSKNGVYIIKLETGTRVLLRKIMISM